MRNWTRVIRDWVKRRLNTYRPPRMSYDDLIDLSLTRQHWEDVNCPVCFSNGCETKMYFRRSNIVDIPDVPVRDDLALKCPRCNHSVHFGNPMTRKEARKEIELRGHSMLMTPSYRLDERNDEELKKRLKALGYGF